MKWLKPIYDINKDHCLIKYGIHKIFHFKKTTINKMYCANVFEKSTFTKTISR